MRAVSRGDYTTTTKEDADPKPNAPRPSSPAVVTITQEPAPKADAAKVGSGGGSGSGSRIILPKTSQVLAPQGRRGEKSHVWIFIDYTACKTCLLSSY